MAMECNGYVETKNLYLRKKNGNHLPNIVDVSIFFIAGQCSNNPTQSLIVANLCSSDSMKMAMISFARHKASTSQVLYRVFICKKRGGSIFSANCAGFRGFKLFEIQVVGCSSAKPVLD